MTAPVAAAPVLEAENISKTFAGQRILKGVGLGLEPGEIKILIGPSGSGKSTLLQCLNCLTLPDEGGVIRLEGRAVNWHENKSLYALRQQVGMIFQDFNLFDHLSALANITVPLRKVRGAAREAARERALLELERVGLAEKADLYPAQLSGGQKQRVAIARALAMDPKVLLLDEPTSALDPELIGEVIAVIKKLAEGGMTMMMATHQMNLIETLADEILFMQAGEIVERGAPAALLAPGCGSRTLGFCSHLGGA